MKYQEIKDFLLNRMRMSHIYQPVMISTLLKNEGEVEAREIAKAISEHDESQVEYYTSITHRMVGRVLRNHKIVRKQGEKYFFEDYDELQEEQIVELINICKEKLDDFLTKRGQRIFEHRRSSAGYISGTLKYEVLKRAKFRCELCGISADEKALEVDHIIPKNKGGSDDISNFQALCYSCNATKRDRDDTDFRAVRESYKYRERGCVFCEAGNASVVTENELSYAIYDKYPVTKYHTLIIPKRHVSSYFGLGQAEINAITQIATTCQEDILTKDRSVSSFNVGVNDGADAGQTIFHCHIHLIPRREGDMPNPRGGVRGVIPDKMNY